MDTARRILREALQLDEGERAALALALMDSLSPPDTRDASAWITEVEHRAQRALSGASASVDADEAMDRISRDLGL